MEPEVFVEVVRSALSLVAVLVTASILPSLVVGLMVAVFQAATSINEQTLSFLPRLIVTILGLMWGAHWGLTKLTEFFYELVHNIPTVVG
ncbi:MULTISPECIES: flagellar biosynthesis protein FliQ [unclassified Anaerobiospirillum]|uniref:flagellar biosynthesis protein FliQ n=1 Tax=unclassified Anaerobiospirillum TaxID=2647410 RepID=UPI001FF37E92|nr:flagellar biosynthesis protein FliQ [Anaerobiospirillum sp. NML120449]MCK0535415.1 flagellar biosynthesis protein FliQ [Anaerobiospirillum sp. NML120511]MCK0541043.1 flagellar biosynthesis protein FliQ [Anaerobiospirillum sp. NML02-A-032]